MLSQRITRSLRFGSGKSFASFGEIVQGRLSSGEDFLVTLPIDRWSVCELTCEAITGASVVESQWTKSRQVIQALLRGLGLDTGHRVTLNFQRSIPIGKGLSSSTADMLAAIRAFQTAFNLTIPARSISGLFHRIEPHDGLHYSSSVAYNHRRGRLLREFRYIPEFQIVAVDAGGQLCTEEYNQHLRFTPELLYQYDALYTELNDAFSHRDTRRIARCARRSAQLHAAQTDNAFLAEVLAVADSLDVLGVLATHSGTCGGLLLPHDAPESEKRQVMEGLSALGDVFQTRTLSMMDTMTRQDQPGHHPCNPAASWLISTQWRSRQWLAPSGSPTSQ